MYHFVVSDQPLNIAARFERMARLWPRLDAVIHPIRRGRRPERTGYFHTNFRKLLELTDRYAAGLQRLGVTRGTRTILMVRPGPDFFALTFALFKLAAPVVLIDPGMGKLRMVKCLETVQAEAFVGIPLAHWLRRMFPGAFRSVRATVTIKPGSFGRRWLLREMQRLQRGEPAVRTPPFALEDGENSPTQKAQFPIADTSADDVAAILFTTGSTGPPKGVVYTHGVFDAQVRMLESVFGMQHGERDLATFPLFALFDAALGVTAVIPDMDPTRPGFAEPERVLTALRDYRCQSMFASPALLGRLTDNRAIFGDVLPRMRRIISAGAAVSPFTLSSYDSMLWGGAQVFTPYGATEALPITSIGHREILEETFEHTLHGAGTCVGRPVDGMTVRAIHISDKPIEAWSEGLLVRPGEVGEFAVKGPVVTTEYLNLPDATRLAKIRDADGTTWHRMGDVGWIDDHGRLWFCGRKAHRVVTPQGTLYTEPVETIFNMHNCVVRTALVGVGARPNQRPVICVELHKRERYHLGLSQPVASHDECPASRSLRGRAKIVAELKHLGARHDFTRHIDTFLFRRNFPVDIRHNAKIFREKLAVWAARKLGVK